LDLSIVQGAFSDAPCQALISRFATFSSPCSTVAMGVAASPAGKKRAKEKPPPPPPPPPADGTPPPPTVKHPLGFKGAIETPVEF
jgi:hypothetical protein